MQDILGGVGVLVFVIDAQVLVCAVLNAAICANMAVTLLLALLYCSYAVYSQDDYIESLSKLYTTVTRVHKLNPNMAFEVFIHKVDGLSDEHKIGRRRWQSVSCSLARSPVALTVHSAVCDIRNAT